MKHIGRLVIALLVLSTGCSNPEPEDAVVRGVVLDPLTGAPIEGVRVRARDVEGEERTDREGRFALRVPPGAHQLWLDREGYIDGRRAGVVVRRGEALEVTAHLFPSAPRDADVARYLASQPPRRHAHPAHERPAPIPSGDVGRVALGTHEPPVLPATIRVWRAGGTAIEPSGANGYADRSCDPAAVVQELPLEEYVRGVVPHEWFPSWHPEALRAGAIAARTYAVSWSLRGGRWECADVDDGTVTQVYRDDRAATADEAIDATASVVVMRGESVISTEYSAENSDPTEHGVAEPTCTGTARFGHGRGMCQWGTHRWASGICANPPCDFGAFGDAPKDHLWMVEHYYPEALAIRGRPAMPCEELGPEGGILEETGPCFQAFGPPEYWREESGAGHDGGLLWTNAFEAATPSNWARWEIRAASPTRFRVEVYVDGEWGRYGATRYVVAHAGGEDIVIVDQGAADGWVELGVFDFETEGVVMLEDSYGPVPADQHIVADALRLSPPSAPPLDGGPPAPQDAGPALDGSLPRQDAGSRATVEASCECGIGAPRGGASSGAWLAIALAATLAARRRAR